MNAFIVKFTNVFEQKNHRIMHINFIFVRFISEVHVQKEKFETDDKIQKEFFGKGKKYILVI